MASLKHAGGGKRVRISFRRGVGSLAMGRERIAGVAVSCNGLLSEGAEDAEDASPVVAAALPMLLPLPLVLSDKTEKEPSLAAALSCKRIK